MLVLPLSIWGLQQERRKDQERNKGALHSKMGKVSCWFGFRWLWGAKKQDKVGDAVIGRWSTSQLWEHATDLSLQLFQISAAEANFSESGCEIPASTNTPCGNNNKVLPWVGKWLYFTVFVQQCSPQRLALHCNTILPDAEGRIIVKECFLFFWAVSF